MVLALGLSTDAFAASVASGMRHPRLSRGQILGAALSFGVIEALAPLVGCVVGVRIAKMVDAFDHWIVFFVLAFIGLRMIIRSMDAGRETDSLIASPGPLAVIALAVATAADGASVGLTLAFFGKDTAMTLAVIGLVTFAMAFIGMNLGRAVGQCYARRLGMIGGAGFILVGAQILVTNWA